MTAHTTMTAHKLLQSAAAHWHVQHKRPEMFAKLGIPFGRGDRIEATAEGEYELEGIRYRLFTSANKPNPSRAGHRLFMVCPCCDRLIPVGRIRQHAKAHPGALDGWKPPSRARDF